MPDYAIDAAPGLIKRATGQAAITANGYIGTPWDQGAAVATDFVAVINIETPKVSAGNETYTFSLVAYNQVNRSDATVVGSASIAAAATTLETVLPAAGDRLVIKARTEKKAVSYRYVDLYVTVGGTSPSLVFNAFLSKDH